jgi:FixJ family two-component response regulator
MDTPVPPLVSARVVIVDDDEAVLNALAFALEAEGFEVQAFRTAADMFAGPGVDAAACLVIDQNLPDEPGLEVLGRLRERGNRTPAVLITTNPAHSLLTKAFSMRAPVIEKPLLGDDLFACIRALARPH